MGVYKPTKSFFGKLFGCMMCLPFWWGVILSITFTSPTMVYINDLFLFNFLLIKNWVLSMFFDGCLASGAVWLIHNFEEALERHGKEKES